MYNLYSQRIVIITIAITQISSILSMYYSWF